MLRLSTITKTLRFTFDKFFSSTLACRAKSDVDPLQAAALKERCFVVDETDKIIGTRTKKDCHTVNKDGSIILHRAFSVFLFNKEKQLLLQKRSDAKITYPGHYTNTCCSHPIADVPGENEEKNALGIKRAAIRRLNYELGIPKSSLNINDFKYITRIQYFDPGNGIYGEHEIDYILFLVANVNMKPNSNEISEITFIPKGELESGLESLHAPLTPWFDLIVKHRLKLWWDNLDNLDKFVDHKNILRLPHCCDKS